MTKQVKSIALCSSASFYRTTGEIKDQLEVLGFRVWMPHTAELMRKSGNYKVRHYKVWYADPKKYHRKAYLMRRHFHEIERADAILVVNECKKGIDGYIGGNVLMEMGIAFYLGKRIFLWNAPSKKSPLYEEIIGVLPVFINGDLDKIK